MDIVFLLGLLLVFRLVWRWWRKAQRLAVLILACMVGLMFISYSILAISSVYDQDFNLIGALSMSVFLTLLYLSIPYSCFLAAIYLGKRYRRRANFRADT